MAEGYQVPPRGKGKKKPTNAHQIAFASGRGKLTESGSLTLSKADRLRAKGAPEWVIRQAEKDAAEVLAYNRGEHHSQTWKRK
jgi:hypothetical protein